MVSTPDSTSARISPRSPFSRVTLPLSPPDRVIITSTRLTRFNGSLSSCTSSTPSFTPARICNTPTSVTRLRASFKRSRIFGEPPSRSEEHTSELQSQSNLVCRLLLEKKKKKQEKQRAQ